MASFTLDAEVSARSFTIDAVIFGAGRWQHHRIDDHYGSDSDLLVVLSSDVGPYVAYTPIHYVLSSILDRLTSLETTTKVRYTFTIDALIDTSGSFTIDARIISMSTVDASFTVDAVFGQGLSFSADAFIAAAFTIDAFIL